MLDNLHKQLAVSSEGKTLPPHLQITIRLLPMLLNYFCIEYISLQKLQFPFLPFKLSLSLEMNVLALPLPSETGNSSLHVKSSFLLRT